MSKNPQEEALSRRDVRVLAVSLVRTQLAGGKSLRRSVEFVCDQLRGDGHSVSRASLFRWMQRLRTRGYRGLNDPVRPSKRTVLPEKFVNFMVETKERDPDISIPTLIELARQKKVIAGSRQLDRSTVYRHARRLNLPLPHKDKNSSHQRPFAYPHRFDMVLCDGKHFRAGVKRLRRVVFYYLDDATRYVLGLVVGTSESSELFLQGLHQVIAMHGKLGGIYLDKGTAFTSEDSSRVAENLDIPLIHGKTRYPQGHGKVERFNQTSLNDCLRGLDKPGIDPSPSALKLRLEHYLLQYHQREHTSLGMSPDKRFHADSSKPSFCWDSQTLQAAFRLSLTRKVSNDNCVSFDGVRYEMPLGYCGMRVQLLTDTLTNDLLFEHQGKLISLQPPDLEYNARSRTSRTKIDAKPKQEGSEHIVTATEISFNSTYHRIVDSDGGYTNKQSEDP